MEQTLCKLEGSEVGDLGAARRLEVSERLWCVHIEGLNDFIATSSRDAALREASAINAYLSRCENGQRGTVARAAVVEWPHTPAGHARSLEEDGEDLQRMVHKQPDANAPRGVLSNIARRVKELIQRTARGI
jgi:hypothetical protein